MNFKIFIGIVYCLLHSIISFGQTGRSNTLKRIPVKDCSVQLNKDFIELSTVRLIIGDSTYSDVVLDMIDSLATIDSTSCTRIGSGQNAILEYRVFPFSFNEKVSLLDTNRMTRRETDIYIGYDLEPYKDPHANDLINAKGLNYNGSFSRGFSVGNSQSLVLNSNFDLQMTGDLGNGLKLAAAISDDNIPIQAEGNTQVLQEFDRVFIEVSKDKHSVIAGDFVLNRPNSYFLNYYKKLKGLGVTTASNINKNTTIQTNANVASSRGKFARQTIAVREGNQGPYRLKGNNDERFIIVLSGSEKVYYNGELIKRGLEYDYIIDYSTADIVFSPNRLVSKETRVIVEFEYTDLNYPRTLYSVQSNIASKKFEVNVNFYSEQDSKSTTSQIELDTTDLLILANSGDDRAKSIRSGIRYVEEENLGSSIGYQLVKNENFPQETDEFILKYSASKDSVEVVAVFTEVGINKGNYAINQSVGANGRVYEYVGENLGSYQPIIELIPPEQKRAMSIGGKYRLSPNTEFIGEIALTDFDKNRLSLIDDGDNVGFAGQVGYSTQFQLSDSSDWKLINKATLEILENDFNPLNPYRTSEFSRDWNTNLQFMEKEQLFNGEIGFSKGSEASILYNYSLYDIRGLFEGKRHGMNVNLNKKGFYLRSKPTYTSTTTQDVSTKFIRPNFEISQGIKKWNNLRIGFTYEGENNEIRSTETDSLFSNAYSFDYLKSYIRTNPDSEVYGAFSYNKRIDRFSNGDDIIPAIDIDEIELSGGWNASTNSNLGFSIKTRDFKVLEPGLVTTESDKRTILGSIDYQLKALNGGVISTTNYQLNSGQEPKLEFVFRKVELGRGDYVYVGSDTTSATQSINDFRFDPTNPLSEYIRITVPNNEFIRTNNLAFNQSFRIDPARFWARDTIPVKGFKKLISKFTTSSTMRLLNKTLDQSGATLDPFAFIAVDSTLVSFNSLNTHAIYFNRTNPKYDLAYTYRNNGNKTNQINGFEQRGIIENEIRLRWNIVRATDLILTGSNGNRTYDSELFDSRDFKIKFLRLNPELNIRMGTSRRLVLKYKFDKRVQQINDKERAVSNDYSIAYNQRQKNNSALDLAFSLVNVDFTGKANTPIEYDILEGLKDGLNYIWRLSYTRRLANNIDLSVTYDGRKTGVAPVVHVGRVQAKATF